MWTENAKCSQINIPLYEFCHSCLCFSVFGDFKLCVFQPVFERACLQLCSLILFVRSAYIQGYDLIWTHVKIDASQKSSEAGRAAFLCVVLTELHFDPVEHCASWRLFEKLLSSNPDLYPGSLGHQCWTKCCGYFLGLTFYCEHHHLITDQATSIYGC